MMDDSGTTQSSRSGWFIVALVATLVIAAWGWRWSSACDLRTHLAIARSVAADRQRLEAQNADLRKLKAAAGDLDSWRSDRAALTRLRDEINAVKDAVEQRKRKPRPGGPVPRTEPLALPADEWRNTGRATARDAFETALWAAAGGDVEVLASVLVLDPAAVPAARQLFASLSKSDQAKYRTPEMLIAWFTAADVTFGSMWVREERRLGSTASLRVLLQWTNASRMPVFTLRRQADGWSLMVPPGAVSKYASALGPAGVEAPR